MLLLLNENKDFHKSHREVSDVNVLPMFLSTLIIKSYVSWKRTKSKGNVQMYSTARFSPQRLDQSSISATGDMPDCRPEQTRSREGSEWRPRNNYHKTS